MSLWLVGVVASLSGSADACSTGGGDLKTLNKAAAFAFSEEARDPSGYDSKKNGIWAPLIDCPITSNAVEGTHLLSGYSGREAISQYRHAACGMLFGRAPPRANVG